MTTIPTFMFAKKVIADADKRIAMKGKVKEILPFLRYYSKKFPNITLLDFITIVKGGLY